MSLEWFFLRSLAEVRLLVLKRCALALRVVLLALVAMCLGVCWCVVSALVGLLALWRALVKALSEAFSTT